MVEQITACSRSRCGTIVAAVCSSRVIDLARSRFTGACSSGTLLFASEPKVLLAHPAVRRNLNLNALRQYLSFDYVPAPLSIYDGISKLPAAHHLTLENGQIEVRRYWQLSYKTSATGAHRGRSCLTASRICSQDSVRMRLVSDVPLGRVAFGRHRFFDGGRRWRCGRLRNGQDLLDPIC